MKRKHLLQREERGKKILAGKENMLGRCHGENGAFKLLLPKRLTLCSISGPVWQCSEVRG